MTSHGIPHTPSLILSCSDISLVAHSLSGDVRPKVLPPSAPCELPELLRLTDPPLLNDAGEFFMSCVCMGGFRKTNGIVR